MANVVRYLEGFEHGITPVTTGGGLARGLTGTPTVDASAARTGGFGLLINPSASADESWDGVLVSGGQSVVALSFYINPRTLDTSGGKYNICAISSNLAGAVYGCVGIDTSNNWCMIWSDGTTAATGSAVGTNAWTLVELLIDMHANPWTAKWRINGVDQTTPSSFAQAASTLKSVSMGAFSPGNRTVVHWFDDIVVIDGTDQSMWLPGIGGFDIEGIKTDQTAAAQHQSITTTQWDTTVNFSTFVNFTSATETTSRGLINDLNTSNGIRVNAASPAGNTRWPVANTTNRGVPRAVSLHTVSREASAGTNNVTFRTRLPAPATINHFSGDPGWSTTFNYLYSCMDIRPGGGSWTLTDVDNITFEMASSDGSPAIWLGGFVYQVAFPTPTGGPKDLGSGSIAATSTVGGSVVRRRPIVPASIAATSVVSGEIQEIQAITTGAIGATSTVAGNVVRRRPIVPSAIAATSSVSGSIKKIAAISGAIAATSTVSGAVVRRRPIAGSIAAQSSVSGAVGRVRHLAGSIAATSTVSGLVGRVRHLTGNIAATSAVSGGVTKIAAIAGAISATSTVSGAVVRIRHLAGSIAATSTVSGIIGRVKPIVPSAISATSTVSGAVGRVKQLVAASVAATSTVSGSLRAIRRVAGAIQAQSQVSGSVGRIRHLSASVAATSTVTGAVGRVKHLAGSVSATSTVAGSVTNIAAITTSAINATSTVAGSIRRLHGLSGAISATSTVTGGVVVRRSIHGASINATSTVSGAITVRTPINADLTCIYTINGLVGSNFTPTYAIFDLVSQSLSPVWNVTGQIHEDLTCVYQILAERPVHAYAYIVKPSTAVGVFSVGGRANGVTPNNNQTTIEREDTDYTVIRRELVSG